MSDASRLAATIQRLEDDTILGRCPNCTEPVTRGDRSPDQGGLPVCPWCRWTGHEEWLR